MGQGVRVGNVGGYQGAVYTDNFQQFLTPTVRVLEKEAGSMIWIQVDASLL